jgi:transketolase
LEVQKKQTSHSIGDLQEISYRLSRQIIEITTEAKSGHPSSSLSCIDLMTVLYFGGMMRYDPDHPSWPERDRFFLSKGHAAPALYVILAEAGYFMPSLLPTLRKFDSPLEGHPNRRRVAGVEASTGSLGEGISIGIGHALATRLDHYDSHVYVLIGDGESEEGQIWEAAMAASKFKLDHLTVILDQNQYQQTGPVNVVMPSLEPIAAKWKAFGWYTIEVNGHNFQEIVSAFEQIGNVKNQPQIMIAHTLKGKGLSPFENDPVSHKHGVALTPDQAKLALAELAAIYPHSQGGEKDENRPN